MSSSAGNIEKRLSSCTSNNFGAINREFDSCWLKWPRFIYVGLSYRAFSLTSCCPPTWCQIAQIDLDIQGSHAHHARTRSSYTWTSNGEVHEETVMHNNVKRCLHKWILIYVAIEAAMLEDSMMSRENTLVLFVTKICLKKRGLFKDVCDLTENLI